MEGAYKLETKPMQYEFTFTRNGQLQAYNGKQVGHMKQLFADYLRNSSVSYTKEAWRAWETMYVTSGMAKEYACEHKKEMFGPIVENQNDKVKMRWDNHSFGKHSIDDYMTGK